MIYQKSCKQNPTKSTNALGRNLYRISICHWPRLNLEDKVGTLPEIRQMERRCAQMLKLVSWNLRNRVCYRLLWTTYMWQIPKTASGVSNLGLYSITIAPSSQLWIEDWRVSSSLRLSLIEILHLQPVAVPNNFLFAVSAPQRPVEQLSYITAK